MSIFITLLAHIFSGHTDITHATTKILFHHLITSTSPERTPLLHSWTRVGTYSTTEVKLIKVLCKSLLNFLDDYKMELVFYSKIYPIFLLSNSMSRRPSTNYVNEVLLDNLSRDLDRVHRTLPTCSPCHDPDFMTD